MEYYFDPYFLRFTEKRDESSDLNMRDRPQKVYADFDSVPAVLESREEDRFRAYGLGKGQRQELPKDGGARYTGSVEKTLELVRPYLPEDTSSEYIMDTLLNSLELGLPLDFLSGLDDNLSSHELLEAMLAY
jgi:hypothetical protein